MIWTAVIHCRFSFSMSLKYTLPKSKNTAFRNQSGDELPQSKPHQLWI